MATTCEVTITAKLDPDSLATVERLERLANRLETLVPKAEAAAEAAPVEKPNAEPESAADPTPPVGSAGPTDADTATDIEVDKSGDEIAEAPAPAGDSAPVATDTEAATPESEITDERGVDATPEPVADPAAPAGDAPAPEAGGDPRL